MFFRHTRASLVISFAVSFAGTSFVTPSLAHDNWISKGGHKNVAGEWCCGDYDCPVLNYSPRVTAAGYQLENGEVVPFSEAMPSPDNTFVRCHRPDGTRRCFFAPKPAS